MEIRGWSCLHHQEMEDLRRKVRAVVNASDPMSLMCEGCPEDEYDAEVEEILDGYLKVGPDPVALTEIIQATFDRWFSPASVPLARSRFMAQRLCDLMPTP